MFDTLLQLPLFQGICMEDFTKILDKAKLNFSKHKAGDILVKRGSACTQLTFLIKGEIISESTAQDATFTVVEYLKAPFLIEPYVLVGMAPYYTSTYIAHTDVHTVSISKETIFGTLFQFEIFRLNYLNILSRRAQTLKARLWEDSPRDVEDKFVHFVLDHIDKPYGEKLLKIKMEDLASYLDNTRLNVSKMLNGLQEKHLLELRRKEIEIPDAARLVTWNREREV